MSTTFGIENNDGEIIEIARRRGAGLGLVKINWLINWHEFVNDEVEVIPLDNTAQGVNTMKDLRNLRRKWEDSKEYLNRKWP